MQCFEKSIHGRTLKHIRKNSVKLWLLCHLCSFLNICLSSIFLQRLHTTCSILCNHRRCLMLYVCVHHVSVTNYLILFTFIWLYHKFDMHHFHFGDVRPEVGTCCSRTTSESVSMLLCLGFYCSQQQHRLMESNSQSPNFLERKIVEMHKSGSADTFATPQQNCTFFCAHQLLLLPLR